MNQFSKKTSSFTLIELLIVIGILAILTAAVVIVLNPSELLKQGRDSTRMTDLASLNKSLQLLLTQNPSLSLGTASTVYISLPDTSPTCSNLGLPALPSGYSYKCVSSASSTLANGQGWLPIDFSTSGIQNMSKLPIDPANTSSTSLYYTYTPNPTTNTYELTTSLESSKYASKEAQDGGVDLAQYELGTNLSLSPFTHGLVGYWSFDEGSGTTAYDGSGWGNNGTMYASSTPTDIHLTVGCKNGRCASFNGVDNYVRNYSFLNSVKNSFTMTLWVYSTNFLPSQFVFEIPGGMPLLAIGSNSVGVTMRSQDDTTWLTYSFSSACLNNNQWNFIAATYDIDDSVRVYCNNLTPSSGTHPGYIGGSPSSMTVGGRATVWYSGYTDDARIYTRALSAAEISAIYNATK